MKDETQRKCLDIAHNAILDKGYAVFDFMFDTSKSKTIKVTRKSQNITCLYINEKTGEWVNEFQKDLSMHTFG